MQTSTELNKAQNANIAAEFCHGYGMFLFIV